MLACRPMLCFAIAVMAGVVSARLFPGVTAHVLWGWPAFLILAIWFLLTPDPEPTIPEALPDGYADSIFPRPGFLARRGLNRFILIACLSLLLLGVQRQEAWRKHLSPARLPEARWFDANLLALAPHRDHPGETGRWQVSALLLTANGKDIGRVPVRLTGPDGPPFRRGDLIQCRVRNDPPGPPAFPGAFDFVFWLERDGLITTLTVVPSRRSPREEAEYVVAAMDDAPLFTRVRRTMDNLRGRAIALTLKYGGRHGGLLAAMLYGYRKDIDDEIRDTFRRVGIGHVLAISGLHVGLIVGLLWWLSGLLGWLAQRRALACLALAIVYLGLSGGQVAAARATLMAVIHLAGIAVGRKSDMMNSLGAAAFLLVLFNPTAPLDVGFQLSFTAVVFIYMAFDRRRMRARPEFPDGVFPRMRKRLTAELGSLVRLSVTTWVGLFPIIALVFHQVNLIGLPVNVVVIPLMSLVLAGGLLLPVLGWIPGLAAVLTAPTRLLSWIAAQSDAIPFSCLPANAPSPWWTALFYAFILFFLLRGVIRDDRRKRRWTFVSLAGCAAAFVGMIAGMDSEPPPAAGRLAALPGRGGGTLVAESPEGGIAVIGRVARGGLNEAEWLRYQRRDGQVGVVAIAGGEVSDLSALAFPFPVAATTLISPRDPASAASTAWTSVAGAPGVEYTVSRDAKGNLVWIAVRIGERSVCLAEPMALRQFTWRLERETHGWDAGLMLVAFKEKEPDLSREPGTKGRVAVYGRAVGSLPPEWFLRRDFGVLVVEDIVRGYDGRDWKSSQME